MNPEYETEVPLEELANLDDGYSLEEHQHVEDFVELLDEDTVYAQAAFKVSGVTWKDVRSTLRRKSSYRARTLSSIRNIIVHHSGTVTGSAEAYARYHVDTLGWPGMGYHIVIEQDGTVKYCNSIETISYHAGNANSYSVGVSMTGDFSKNKPTAAQWKALYKVIEELRRVCPNASAVTKVIGHQEAPGYAWKPCPSLDMDAMRGQIQSKSYQAVANKFNNDQQIKVTGGGVVAKEPAKKEGIYGRKDIQGTIKVLVDDLWYYSKADWNAKKAKVHKGEVFTVEREMYVDGYKMYRLKSKNYITASEQFVQFKKK